MWSDVWIGLACGLACGLVMWLWQRHQARVGGKNPRDPRLAWAAVVFGCALAAAFVTRPVLEHRGWGFVPAAAVSLLVAAALAAGLTALGAALHPALRAPSLRDDDRRS